MSVLATIRVFVLALSLLGVHAHAASEDAKSVTALPQAVLQPQEVAFNRSRLAEWNVDTGLDGYHHGDKDQGDAAYAHLSGNFRLALAPWLHLVGRPRLDFYSARVQERFDADEYQSGVRLSEGYVGLAPFEALELRAGFINQGYFGQDMLMSGRRAFPGVQESLSWNFESLRLELVAEQVIPTSYSVDDQREDKEQLPLLQIQELKLSGKALSWLEWKGMAGHYAWTNPPDKVAFQSAQWGNSVEGVVAAGSRFKFQFEGWLLGAEVCYCSTQSRLQWVGEFQRLHNSGADAGLGDAQLIGTGPRLVFGARTLDLRYRRLFIEKDVTIAAYTSSGFAGTNREMDSVDLRLHFSDYKFAIVAGWLGSTVLRDNDIQSPHNTYRVGVETDYAPF